MKNLMNRYLGGLAIAIFILSTASSMVGQTQGCGKDSNIFLYDEKRTYVSRGVDRRKINKAITGERLLSIENEFKFYFTFKTKDEVVRIVKGDNIVFEPSLTADKTGALSAIYYKANEDFTKQINGDKYLLPLPPGDNGKPDAWLIPYTYYYLGENMVFRVPPPPEPDPRQSIKVNVRKLSGLEFDTDDLDYGFYWFTLQGTAVVNERQNPDNCTKTTPPVLIEIVRRLEYRNYQPTVSVKVAGEYCYQKTITVEAGDRNNEPNDPLNPQMITLSWKITNKTTGAVVKSDKVTFTSATYNVNIPTGDIKLGNYTVEADVDDGRLKNSTRGGLDNTDLDLKCKGAGIAYFQFDEPFDSEKRKIRFNAGYYTNPEDWVAVNTRVKVKNQCKNSQGLYPEQEFPDFYETFFGKGTTPFPVENNTEKLKRIIDTLIANPNYRIIIRGYADFRNSDDYNVALVERRLQVVKNYLESRSKELGSPITNERYTLIRNLYDSKSRCKYEGDFKNSCYVERRQDRRVELIYYADAFTVEQLGIPEYAPSGCDPNAMLVNLDEIEWEADE